MVNEIGKRNGMWGWGISASILFHAVIALVILVDIPFDLPRPEAEEVVSVEIVPPQEEEEKAQEAEEPPAPEPQPQQQAEAPPPAPAPAPTPDTAGDADPAQPLAGFRPVFRFGEDDTGPKPSDEGEAAMEGRVTENPPEPLEEPQEQQEPQQADQQPEAPPTPDAAAEPADPQTETAAEAQLKDAEEAQDSADAASVPPELTVPDSDNGSAVAEAVGIPVPVPAPRDEALKAEIAAAQPPQASEAQEAVKPAEKTTMPSAKRLFSPEATDNPMAAIAMSGMSAGERAAELCNTELREQLRHGSPAYSPDVLPKPRLTGDNVIDVRAIGFRARQQWYDVSFHCEVDKDATRVVSFAHQVGGAIPKGEWRKRGFPAY